MHMYESMVLICFHCVFLWNQRKCVLSTTHYNHDIIQLLRLVTFIDCQNYSKIKWCIFTLAFSNISVASRICFSLHILVPNFFLRIFLYLRNLLYKSQIKCVTQLTKRYKYMSKFFRPENLFLIILCNIFTILTVVLTSFCFL